VLEAERRNKAEEDAKIAAREKAVLAAKAEAERRVQEAAAQSRAKKDAEEAEQRRVAEAKQAEDANAAAKLRAADEKEQTAAEWRIRVEVQKRMKGEVIEPFKQGVVEGKAEIRKAMRLVTRGLGQVVNTKSSIVRVVSGSDTQHVFILTWQTEDIQGILNTYLPSPPTAAAPTTLDQRPPVAYCYLLSHLSKALIKQAEHEIAANTDAAFPLGRIVVGLLLRGHAAFGEVLFARLVKKCPWVVPYYPSRQPVS
jgi:nucleoporin GLE1